MCALEQELQRERGRVQEARVAMEGEIRGIETTDSFVALNFCDRNNFWPQNLTAPNLSVVFMAEQELKTERRRA